MSAEVRNSDWNPLIQKLSEVSHTLASQYFDQLDASFRMKHPVIALEDMRVDSLSHSYQIDSGADDEFIIGLNSKWAHRPLWEICESLAHEMVHIYQESHPTLAKSFSWRHHTQTFVNIANDLGLHVTRPSGRHFAPADGTFKGIMEQYGIPRPEFVDESLMKGVKKGYWWDMDRKGQVDSKSTMILYTNDKCVLEPNCKIRSGRMDLKISCDTCGGHFEPATTNLRDDNPERFKFKAISS